MNTVPAARSDMATHSLQCGIFCHIASGCPRYPIQNHGEIYDVTHYTSNILLSSMQKTEPASMLLGAPSPLSIYIVNPIRELVSRSVPVRTIGNSITGHLPLILQYTHLGDASPAGTARSLTTWDIYILNWLLDRY